MAENTIDTLSLQIESDAQKSFKSIDRLTSSLIGLGKATDRINAKSFGNLSQNIKSFSSAVRGLKNVAIPDFSGIVNSFTRLNGATFDTSGINNVAKALKGLASVDTGKFNGTDFSQITSSIGQLANIPDVSNSLNRFVSSLQKLANAGDKITPVANNLPILGNSLRNVVNTMAGAATVSDSVNQFTQSIGRLASAGAKTTQTAAGLDALAEKTKDFFTAMQNAPQVSENTIRMTQALAQLAAAENKVGNVSGSLSKSFETFSKGKKTSGVIRSLTSSLRSFGNTAQKTEKKTTSLALSLGKLVAAFYAIKRIGKGLFDSVESSMDYLETFNYFNAAFNQVANNATGEWRKAGYKSAEEYANSFSKRARELTSKMTGFIISDNGLMSETGGVSLGIDPDMLLNYQATFGQISSSMGVASENALRLSNALTMIGADLASVRNEDFSKVYDNLTSGIVGMSRAVDKYGVNIRVANLEQQAQALGINASISSMSQADKALLRTITILDSTRYAWADLSKTINMPSNQLRLLRQNFNSLSRSIGNIFLPIVAKVLPYLNAMTIALRRLFEFIGKLLGVDKTIGNWGASISGGSDALSEALDSIDTDIPTDGVDNLGDSLSNAKDKAKQLEKRLASWDELEVINQNQDSLDDYELPSMSDLAGDGIDDYSDVLGGALDDILSEYEKAWNDAFNSIDNKAVKIANNIEKAFKKLAKTAKPTTSAIKRLWNDGLKKLGSFTWDTIKDFWNNFLKPMGTWMLSDDAGLPRFFNITNDLLNEIDWDRLNTSLENFFTSLQKPAKFVWTSLMDFYEKFLKPISVWTMSEAIPDLVDALTDFNNKIKWDEINKALSDFWEALEPFAESVGRGLVNFFKDLLSVGADFINATVPDGLNSLADAIKKISPETAEKIGEGIGKIALALAGFKGLHKISQLFDKKGAIGKIFVELAKHPYFTIASGVLAVVGALDNFGIIDVDWEFLTGKLKDIKDILADFVKKIDWESIKDGIGKLWDAFQPFAEGFADGFIGALRTIVIDIGAPLINGIASAFEKLASALDMLPDDMLEGIGKGLGSIAAALLTIKGTKSIIGKLQDLIKTMGKLGGAKKAVDTGKSIAEGAAGAGTAGAGKGLLTAAKEKLSTIGSSGIGSGLLTVGAGAGAGVLLAGTLKKIDEAQEKMSGKNGIISQLGLLTNALGYPADKGLEQKINDLTESLENANAPVSEWATQFSDLFKKAGVSVDDLNQLLIKGFGGAVNFAGEQGALYEQIVAKMSEAEANASASDKAAAENRAKGFDALRTALEKTSEQSAGLESQFGFLRDELDAQETSGQNVESAYQHIIDLMDGWGVNIAANKDLISLFGDEVDTTMSEIGVSFQNASSNIQTETSGINQNISAVKTEAENATTATEGIEGAARNVVGGFLTFAANALLMSTGLGSIETGSKNAGSKLSELGDNITNFVGGLATSAKKVFDEGKKTGANFPTGFAKGINEKEKEVVNASQKLVDSVTNPVKTGLDINSPSGVARGFGENYVQGLINGITSRMGELGTAIGNIVKTMTNQFSGVLFQNFRTYGQNLMISLQNGIYSQHISLPYIQVMAFDHYTMGNSTLSIPRFGLKYYAKGGLFTKPGLGIFGEGKDDEAALPLNDSVYKRIATGIVNNMPKIDIGNIEINRSQAPYVTTENIPKSTYSNSFGEDMRKDIAAISSNTYNNNAGMAAAVKEALNGAAIYAEDHIIGYLQFKNQQARNQNGGLGFLEV